MKIASYNVENLFDRAKAFNEDSAKAQLVVKQEGKTVYIPTKLY